MTSNTHAASGSKAVVWVGRVISALIVVLMAAGGVFTLINPAQAKAGFAQQGYPDRYFSAIIIVEMVCVILYAIPQTAVLGAVLLTGYLGGAVATHVRMSEGTFVIAVVVGVLVWLGLYLRDARVRSLLPLRR